MQNPMRSPYFVFLVSFVVLWLSARIGVGFRRREVPDEDTRHDLDLAVAATLTLLGLLIGFTFSMATSRYDQRKNYEEAEANAIGTEYTRADLLPAADAAATRTLLKNYLDLRISFYGLRDPQRLRENDAQTARMQDDLWSGVRTPAMAQPNPLLALVVSGMNDVLNAQGYTQAAWLNRIPLSAWLLMGVIALLCNAMIGYGAGKRKSRSIVLALLPLAVSMSFFLIADIDSPRGGIIRVNP